MRVLFSLFSKGYFFALFWATQGWMDGWMDIWTGLAWPIGFYEIQRVYNDGFFFLSFTIV